MDANRYAGDFSVRSWRAAPGGGLVLELRASQGLATAEIGIAENGSVRLRAGLGARLPPDPSAAIDREPWRGAGSLPEERAGGGIRLEHDGREGSAHVEIETCPLRVRVRERSGAVLAELAELGFDAAGGARCRLPASSEERFFGFGETRGSLDKRGQRILLRNRDPELASGNPRYLGIPFFLGVRQAAGRSAARGIFVDAPGPSHFDVAAEDAGHVAIETSAGGLDLTVLPGPLPADVLRRFSDRVGRAPLPPLWALGHHQSRWSYGSERSVRRLAAGLRRRGIPTDVIHLDIDYMDGYRVFTWNAKRFPNPKQLVADLAADGFRVVAIVDPGVKIDPAYPVYRDGEERRFFLESDTGEIARVCVWPKYAALPDFNRAEVRRWWGEQHRALTDVGVAGVWNDMNEPAGWGRDLRIGRVMLPYRKQDLSRARQADPGEPDRRVPHEQVRNLYGQQECRATRAFLEDANPEQRPFVLTRSGSAGIQKYAAVWTGDNRSSWSSLRESIPLLLNLSLSGVPFCGSDIGGFFGSCTPELFARWIQLGSLYPFARTHSMWLTRRQEPWSFGPRVEAIARRALELRMRLLPYLYGLFHEASATGQPVWRTLFYEFPDDEGATAIDDQLMLGPSLLVAPVLERGAREREIYLPPGVWIGFDDDSRWRGPRRLRVAAPLERLPLFVRAGSVIPTREPAVHVGASASDASLEVFPGAEGSGVWIEDDGFTTAYREGAVARTPWRLWDRAGGRLRLEIGRREGAYEPPQRPLRISLRACPAPAAVLLDGDRLSASDGDRLSASDGDRLSASDGTPGYRRRASGVEVRLEDDGLAHTLEIEPPP